MKRRVKSMKNEANHMRPKGPIDMVRRVAGCCLC